MRTGPAPLPAVVLPGILPRERSAAPLAVDHPSGVVHRQRGRPARVARWHRGGRPMAVHQERPARRRADDPAGIPTRLLHDRAPTRCASQGATVAAAVLAYCFALLGGERCSADGDLAALDSGVGRVADAHQSELAGLRAAGTAGALPAGVAGGRDERITAFRACGRCYRVHVGPPFGSAAPRDGGCRRRGSPYSRRSGRPLWTGSGREAGVLLGWPATAEVAAGGAPRGCALPAGPGGMAGMAGASEVAERVIIAVADVVGFGAGRTSAVRTDHAPGVAAEHSGPDGAGPVGRQGGAAG